MNGLEQHLDEKRESLPSENRGNPSKAGAPWPLLAVVPLLLCIGCLALTIASAQIISRRLVHPNLPVTGGDLPTTQAPEIPDELRPSLPGDPIPVPGQVYRAEVDRVLSACYVSFHEFYLFEEMILSEPGMLESEQWRTEAHSAIDSFREDCEGLGNLPDAPNLYEEVDHWLKLAAAEVTPAAENLTRVLGSPGAEIRQEDDFRRAVEHMMNFVEYTHAAEEALSSMDDRREVFQRGTDTLTSVP